MHCIQRDKLKIHMVRAKEQWVELVNRPSELLMTATNWLGTTIWLGRDENNESKGGVHRQAWWCGLVTHGMIMKKAPTVVPMEITFMDNGGNIFVLDEFIEQMNSYIWIRTCESYLLDEFTWNPYRFLISSLGSQSFFLRIAKRER